MKKPHIITVIAFTISVTVALFLNTITVNNPQHNTDLITAKPQPIISPVTITDFSSSVFIGDSRTQGLMMFGGITEATYYTGTGITVTDVLNKPLVKKDKEEITILDALKENTFDNIIIMLGTNELGWAYKESFKDAYNLMLEEIINACPDSKIYIQLIMPVNRNFINEPKDYINNQRIVEYNEIIKELCVNKNIDFLDTYNLMCNKDGNLYTNASPDGIHLNAAFCKRWVKFMKGETVYEIIE